MDTINLVTSFHLNKIQGKPKGHVLGMMDSWRYCNPDRVSMLDKEEWFVRKYKTMGADIYDELNALKVPIIVQKPWKYLENQQVYPLKGIINKFGIKYFTCSQAYLLALALYEGYKNIKLIGWYNPVPYSLDAEWNAIVWDEIMCQNFWIGFLKAKRINITGGNLAKPITPDNEPLYAYNVSPIHKRKRKEMLDNLK